MKLLRLNLQHFSEEPAQEPTAAEPENNPDKAFSQAEVDEIIAKRLKREREKQEEKERLVREEAERNSLKEQNRYKELYEQMLQETQTLKVDSALSKAGYSEDQVVRYRKFIDGSSDAEIQASLATLMEDIPPKKAYVDPSLSKPQPSEPKPADSADLGRELYHKIKGNRGK